MVLYLISYKLEHVRDALLSVGSSHKPRSYYFDCDRKRWDNHLQQRFAATQLYCCSIDFACSVSHLMMIALSSLRCHCVLS